MNGLRFPRRSSDVSGFSIKPDTLVVGWVEVFIPGHTWRMPVDEADAFADEMKRAAAEARARLPKPAAQSG